MKIKVIFLMVLLIVFFSVISVILVINYGYSDNINDETIQNTKNNSCIELGCSENTKYVGSVNSDKYYECNCRYAKNILRENLMCFESEEQALQEGYIRTEC